VVDLSTADTLVLAWHGSRNPAGRELIERIARRVAGRLPGRAVHVAWVDIEPVQLAETLAGVGDCVLVPCFLAAGYHATHDVVTAHLNGALDGVLLDRVREAGGAGDAVVLAAAGSKSPVATAEVDATAARLAVALGVPVTVGNIYQSAPSVTDAVAAASGDVLVLPYALAPGLWGERIAGLGARVADPLGDHDGITAAIVERYAAAVRLAEAPRAAA
jgi:sirohydrochlorin ferrochelatase